MPPPGMPMPGDAAAPGGLPVTTYTCKSCGNVHTGAMPTTCSRCGVRFDEVSGKTTRLSGGAWAGIITGIVLFLGLIAAGIKTVFS